MGYSKDAVKGIGWMSGLQLLIRAIAIVKIIIIARILTPTDLGIFGMAILALGLFETFTEIGISTFLIQLKSDLKDYVNDAFLIQLGRGVIISIILAAFSFSISIYFKEYRIFYPLLFLSLIPFIKSLENPYIVVFQKELQFHREFFYRFIFVFIDFLVCIPIAFMTHSYYSLVFGLLVSTSTGTFFSWILIKSKPKLRFKLKNAIHIFSFIKFVTPVGILMYILNTIDQIIIGRIYSASALGIYQIAQKFSNTPMIELSDVFGKVTLPIYTKIYTDTKRLARAYIKSITSLIGIEFLILVLLFFFSKDIILLTIGNQWVDGVELLRIFAIEGFMLSVSGSVGALFYSIGKPEVLTKIAIMRLILLIPLLWWGITSFGIKGAVYASMISLLLAQPYVIVKVVQVFRK